MEKANLISVIIPFYNREKQLLDRCVDSVLKQTNQFFECIIVDDGSKEEYKSFLPEFELLDSRIRVVHQENRGAGSARNFGIKNARGNYVFFLDSDDYISPYTLKVGLEAAIETNADMVVGGLKHIRPDEKPGFQEKAKRIIIIESNEEKQKYIHHISAISQPEYQLERGMTGISPCSKLVKKKMAAAIPFMEDKYWDEDDIWNITFTHQCKRIVIADILWYAYIINPDSMVRGYAGDRTKEFQFRAKQEYDLIQKLWPDCMQAAYYHVWDGLLRYCRTDAFQPKNPHSGRQKYKNFVKAISFKEFYESMRKIDFNIEDRLVFRIAKKIVKRLLLFPYKRPAYIAMFFTNKTIVF